MDFDKETKFPLPFLTKEPLVQSAVVEEVEVELEVLSVVQSVVVEVEVEVEVVVVDAKVES